MRKVLASLIFCGLVLTMNGQTENSINWLSWDEAIALNEEEPKKVFIDIYTDWCIPCKKMDERTYAYPEVIDYVNKNFRAIRFNAEQKDSIVYKGVTFHLKPDAGRNGLHELAVSLSDGKLSFPMTIFFSERMKRTTILPGYMDPVDFGVALKFHGEEHYKNTKWKDYPNDGIISRKAYLAARRASIAKSNTAASPIAMATKTPTSEPAPIPSSAKPKEEIEEPASLESQLRLATPSQSTQVEEPILSKRDKKLAEKKLKEEQEALSKRLEEEKKANLALAKQREKEAAKAAKKAKPSKKELRQEKKRLEEEEARALAKAKIEAEKMKKLAEEKAKADAKRAKEEAKLAKKNTPSKRDLKKEKKRQEELEKEAQAKAEKLAEGQRRLAEQQKKEAEKLAKKQKKLAKKNAPSKKEIREEKERQEEALAKAKLVEEGRRRLEEKQKAALALEKERVEPSVLTEEKTINLEAEPASDATVEPTQPKTLSKIELNQIAQDVALVKALEVELGEEKLAALKRVMKNELKAELYDQLKTEIKNELLDELKKSLKQ